MTRHRHRRVLGLPDDIRVDKDVPFNKIPVKGRQRQLVRAYDPVILRCA